MMMGVDCQDLAVTFEDIKLKRATFLTRDESHLTVMIHRGNFSEKASRLFSKAMLLYRFWKV